MRAAASATVVLLLLLAGCSSPEGPPGGGSPSATGSSSGNPSATGTAQPTAAPTGQPTGSPTGSPPGPGPAPPPPAPPRAWPELSDGRIRPGVQTFTAGGGQCTSNFLFLSPDNATVYIGQAAHCAGTGGPMETNGCETGTLPLGTEVTVVGTDGGRHEGRMVYSSWVTMLALKEGDADACANNDFALVELSGDAAAVAHPAMLHYGGPTGLADPAAVAFGDKVLTYGNSGARFGVKQTSPKEGWVLREPRDGWGMTVYTVTPGVPGDSGSGVVTGDGKAIADLVTVGADGSNGATVLAKALDYARERGGLDVRLATWELLADGSLPPL